MKINLLIVLFMLAMLAGKAQTLTVHPTIDSVKVKYKAQSQATLIAQNRFNVIPGASFMLKDTLNVSLIRVMICQVPGDSLLYDLQYAINSPSVSNPAGKKLFERKKSSVFVSPGVVLPLRLYKYKLSTEDSLHVSSTLFTVTR